jgi:hypothetical protein
MWTTGGLGGGSKENAVSGLHVAAGTFLEIKGKIASEKQRPHDWEDKRERRLFFNCHFATCRAFLG